MMAKGTRALESLADAPSRFRVRPELKVFRCRRVRPHASCRKKTATCDSSQAVRSSQGSIVIVKTSGATACGHE